MRNAIEPAGEVVCPNCSDANEAAADFCSACGAPVGRFTTLDPVKAIYAEGWVLRKSANARIGPMVLIGMWVLGIPMAATFVQALLRPEGPDAVRALSSLGVAFIYLLVLVRVTRNYVRNRPGRGPYDPGP